MRNPLFPEERVQPLSCELCPALPKEPSPGLTRIGSSLYGALFALLSAHLIRAAALAHPAANTTRHETGWSLHHFLPVVPQNWLLPMFILGPVLAAGAYLAACLLLQKLTLCKQKKLRLVIFSTLILTLIGVFQSCTFSTDVILYYFMGFAQEQASSNPYLVGMSAIPKEVLQTYFPGGFGTLANTVVYGPGLVWLYSKIFLLSGGQFQTGLFLLKLLSGLAYLGILTIAWHLSESTAPDKSIKMLPWLAWNPLLCQELVAEAHNEVLILFVLMASLLCLKKNLPLLAIGLACLSVYLKVTIGLVVLFFCLYFWQTDRRKILFVIFALAAWGLLFIQHFGLESVWSLFGNIKKHESFMVNAFPTALLHSVKLFFSQVGLDRELFKSLALAAFSFSKILRVVVLLFLYRFYKNSEKSIDSLSYLAGHSYLWMYLFCIFFLWPHYFALPLVLCLWAGGPENSKACLYLSLVISYIHLTQIYPLNFGERGLVLLGLYLPALWLALREFINYEPAQKSAAQESTRPDATSDKVGPVR